MNGTCPKCKAPIRKCPDVVDDKLENITLSAKALRPHDCRTYAVWGEAVVQPGGGSP